MTSKSIHPFPFNDGAFLAAGLGAFFFGSALCDAAPHGEGPTAPIWPTTEWQTASPEEEGMDSNELVKLIDFGTTRRFDSLLVVRHGKIVAEAYYAPYATGIPHEVFSAVKGVISTLIAIASKERLLDTPNHRVLDFFDRQNFANIDESKETITVQNLLNMASGLGWKQPDSMFEMERSPDWVKFVLDKPMVSAPGSIFNYSNGNAHI